MNSKSCLREKPTLIRQKSMAEHFPTRKIPVSRSKTPPPRLNQGIQTVPKDENTIKPAPGKNVSATSAVMRSRPPTVTRSVEDLNLVNQVKVPIKFNRDLLSRDDTLALRYSAYLQSCLMIAHSKNVIKRRENKIVRQLEELQTKLLDIDEKISSLKVNSEKLKLYKQMKQKFAKQIRDFEDLNNSIDMKLTNEKINTLERNLNDLQLKNFNIPVSPQTAGEIAQYLTDIHDDLKLLPDLEKKILPLTNLHSSIIKTRENIQEEELLKKDCEKKMREAEEYVIHKCFTKSLREF